MTPFIPPGFDSLPEEIVTLIFVEGDWQDVTTLGVRESHALSSGKLYEVPVYSMAVKQAGGALLIDEERGVRSYLPRATGPHERIFAGWIKEPGYSIEGAQTMITTIQAQGYFSWLKEPPFQLETRLLIGSFSWLPNHPFEVNTVIRPNPPDGHKYRCSTAGNSGPTMPVFDSGTGATTAEPAAWTAGRTVIVGDIVRAAPSNSHKFRCTIGGVTHTSQPTWNTGTGAITNETGGVQWQEAGSDAGYAVWTEDGSSMVSDTDALEIILVAFFGALGTNITFTGRNTMLADVGYMEFEAGTPIEQCLQAVQAVVTSAHSDLFTAWEADTEYTRGDLRVPAPADGRYFMQLETIGISGHSAPDWASAVDPGDQVIDNSATWLLMGNTSVLPVYDLVVPPDNSDHTASWMPNFVWYDINSDALTPTLTQEYWTGPYEDELHINTLDMKLSRTSAETGNTVYVFGDPETGAASGPVPDPTRVLHDGRGRSLVYHMPELKTNDECRAVANNILGKLITRETVSGTALTVPDEAIRALYAGGRRKVKFTNELFGLSSLPYAISSIALTMPDGIGHHAFQAGSGFLGMTDDVLQNQIAGRKYMGASGAPALVRWVDDEGDPNYFLVDNFVDPDSLLVTVVIRWLSGNENNLSRFYGYVDVEGEDRHRTQPPVFWPRQTMVIQGLPQDVEVTPYIQSVNTRGQSQRDPITGEVIYSQGPTFTTAHLTVAPPTALHLDTGVGSGGFFYDTPLVASAELAWTPPAVAPDYYILHRGLIVDAVEIPQPGVIIDGAATHMRVEGFVVGHTYEPYMIAYRGAYQSDACVINTPFTVPSETVDPPEISLYRNVYRRDGNKAEIQIDRTDSTSPGIAGYYLIVQETLGDGATITYRVDMKMNTRAIFLAAAGAAMVVNGFAINAAGRESSASNTLTFPAASIVKPPPPIDFNHDRTDGLTDANLYFSWGAPPTTGSDESDHIPAALVAGYELAAKPSTWSHARVQPAQSDVLAAQMAGLPFSIETVVGVRTVDIWGNKSDPEELTLTPALLGANLVLGPDMEAAGSDYMPAHWTSPDASYPNVSRSETYAAQGVASLGFIGVDVPGGDTLEAWCEPFLLQEGEQYQIDFDAYKTGDAGYYELYAVEQPDDDPEYHGALDSGDARFDIPTANKWQHVSGVLDLTVTTGHRQWWLAFRLELINPGDEPQMYIDNVSIRKMSNINHPPPALGAMPGELWGPETNAQSAVAIQSSATDKTTITAQAIEGQSAALYEGKNTAGDVTSSIKPSGEAYLDSLIIGAGGTKISHHFSDVYSLTGWGLCRAVQDGGTSNQQEQTVTITGADVGDSVAVTPMYAIEDGLTWFGYVLTTDTVKIRLINTSYDNGVTPTDGDWRIDVWQH